MNLKLLIKVSLLSLALVLVFIAKEGTFSPKFKDQVAMFFGVYKQKTINWCADHVTDVTVVDLGISENFKQIPMADLREKYCSLPVENINHIDINTVVWTTLFESTGATGIKSDIQWSKQYQLFRVKELPFKSSELFKKLTSN